MSKNKQIDFWDAVDALIIGCIDEGKEGKLILAFEKRTIELHVHEAGKAEAEFEKMMQNAVKNGKVMMGKNS